MNSKALAAAGEAQHVLAVEFRQYLRNGGAFRPSRAPLALRLSPDEAAVLASPYSMLHGAALKPVVLCQEFSGHA